MFKSLLLTLLVICPALADLKNDLAGIWEHKQAGAAAAQLTIILKADGTATVADEQAKWTVDGAALKLDMSGETTTYQVKLEGEKLTLSGGDLDKPTEFARKVPPKKGLGGKLKEGTPEKSAPDRQSPDQQSPGQPAPRNPLDVGNQPPPRNPLDAGNQPGMQPGVQPSVQPGPAPSVPGSGAWVGNDGTKDLTVQLNPDGTGTLNGEALRWKLDGGILTVQTGGDLVMYYATVTDTELALKGGNLKQPLTLKRPAGAAPGPLTPGPLTPGPLTPGVPNPLDHGPVPEAPKAQGIVGIWTDGNGQIEFRADGSCLYVGVQMTYTAKDGVLALNGPGGNVQMQYRVEGDKLTCTVNGETQTLTRVGARAGANPMPGLPGAQPGAQPAGPQGAGKIAGVYCVTEASVDPQNVMTFTQYIMLYPDGNLGYAKNEGGASRTQVSDCIEKFSSYKSGKSQEQSLGKWTSDGESLQISWTRNGKTCYGKVQQDGSLLIDGMAVINEGEMLKFEKK